MRKTQFKLGTSRLERQALEIPACFLWKLRDLWPQPAGGGRNPLTVWTGSPRSSAESGREVRGCLLLRAEEFERAGGFHRGEQASLRAARQQFAHSLATALAATERPAVHVHAHELV